MPPSKKKKSRTPSKISDSDPFGDESVVSGGSSSVSSPFVPTNERLQSKVDGASARFPSLISTAAFVGEVVETRVVESEGCKVWLSESVMVSYSIPYGSLVSVSLLSLDKGPSSFPLSSLSDECASQFGFQSGGTMTDEAGNFFTMATVNPSCKDLKNGVCLSADLFYQMGCPQLGRIVLIQPVKADTSTEKVINQPPGPSTIISLEDCKELCLFPVCLLPKAKMRRRAVSSSKLSTEITSVLDPTSKTSSSPVHLTSSVSSVPSQPADCHSLSGNDASNSILALEHLLGDDSATKLQERCALMWLMFRHLLFGNFVTIHLLQGPCLFQVVDAKIFSSKIKTMNSMHQNESSSELQIRNNLVSVFFVSRDTNVRFLHPSHPLVGISSRLFVSPSEFRSESESSISCNFRKLAGLSREYAVLKDIILTSAAQDLFKRFGVRPVKGVLLHGPPGTGKTTLARACAQDAGANLFTINGPEIISQYHGETEQALHEVFDKAGKSSPAVVFIDELDAIAPSRKDGGDDLSQRMVNTLLTSMDGFTETEGMLVIAATNRPASIDPALRRQGRFDREIEIGVPSPGERHEILVSFLSEMKHSLSDKDIEDIAMSTHGFVGADLAALCNEAAFFCLRRYIESKTSLDHSNCKFCSVDFDSACGVSSSQDFSTEDDLDALQAAEDFLNSDMGVEASGSCTSMVQGSSDIKNELEMNGQCCQNDNLIVNLGDFEKARVRTRPSAMREINLEVPRVSWEDVGGQMEVKAQLREAVIWPQKHKDAFQRIGTRPPTGVLLFGPPGCSKTMLARAVASEARLNFLSVKGPELFSKWVGESEKAVRSLFAKARVNAPSIIFFDEIDGLASTRGRENDGASVGDRVINQLLVEMNGLHQRGDVIVIAATNRPDKIDPALLRPGRFDRVVYVGLPNRKDREDIFRVYLSRRPCSSDVSIPELSRLTEGCTGADIMRICNEGGISALEEDLSASEIKMKHLEAGVELVEPTDARMYEKLSSKFQRHVRSTDVEPQQSSSSSTSLWSRMQSTGLPLLHLLGLVSREET